MYYSCFDSLYLGILVGWFVAPIFHIVSVPFALWFWDSSHQERMQIFGPPEYRLALAMTCFGSYSMGKVTVGQPKYKPWALPLSVGTLPQLLERSAKGLDATWKNLVVLAKAIWKQLSTKTWPQLTTNAYVSSVHTLTRVQ